MTVELGETCCRCRVELSSGRDTMMKAQPVAEIRAAERPSERAHYEWKVKITEAKILTENPKVAGSRDARIVGHPDSRLWAARSVCWTSGLGQKTQSSQVHHLSLVETIRLHTESCKDGNGWDSERGAYI